MRTTLYGIANCDKCREARRWFDNAGADYRFHDLRSDGIDATDIRTWLEQVPTETLVNRRSRTWRELPASQRTLDDPAAVGKLLCRHPTLIKRPVAVTGDVIDVGYDEKAWRTRHLD
jgi:Spx/MgsR family transcriptional regulator